MRVVLDTNILVSAFVFAGICLRLVDRCIDDHRIILSDAILAEFSRVLIGRFDYDYDAVRAAIESMMSSVEIVEPVTFDRQICRDADDDAILGTAVAGQADCIVTGDNDLLVLERFRGVDIIAPSEFERYEVESSV